MKKKFTFMMAVLALLTFLAVPMGMRGQTKSTITISYGDNFEPALPSTSATVNTSATAHTDETAAANSFKFKEKSIYKGSSNNYLMFVENAGYLYNTENLGTINSVAVTYSSGTSTKGKAGVYFGSSEQSTYTTTSNATIKGQSQTDTWTNNTTGNGFFQFSTSNKNVQVTQIVITYTASSGPTVSAPEFNPVSGTSFYPTLELTMTSSTEGASIRYTTDGTAPTSSTGTVYDSENKPVLNATTTVKAIAYKTINNNVVSSSVSEATFTKVTPLANIAALTENTETGTYYVTFTNAVVTYTNGNYAYIQDESGAVLMYKNGHGLTAGDVLNGTATVSYKLQNNTPEITSLAGVTSVSGAAPNPTTVVASEWNYTFNNVLSQYLKITDAKITLLNNKYYVSVGSAKAVESIQLYGQGDASNFSISGLTSDDVFTIIGFPMLYNSTKEFQIFVVPQKAEINIDASALELPYNANNNGSIAVSYSNFEPYETTATLYSNQECTTPFSGSWIELGDLSDPYTSIPYTVEENAGNSDRIVYLKVESMNENTSVISKKFTITQVYHQTYSVTYKANGGSGEDLVVPGYDYNATVTVKPNTGTGNPNFSKSGYDFQNWNTLANGTGTSYIPNDNEHNSFSITANTDLYAQWQAKTYDLNIDPDMEHGVVSFTVGGNSATTAKTDQTVTLVVAPSTGYALSSLTVTNDDTSETVTVSNNTFTMPASSITVTATFEEVFSYNVNFESATSTYTDWVFTDMTSQGTHNDVTAHGGSYFGTTNAKNPSYITTTNKIANPQSITFYVTRQTTNSTASTWAVQVSSDGSTWTTVGETQSAISMNKGTWVEVTRDLSLNSYKNSYVRIYYSGSTATRNIDDIQLVYTPDRHKVTVANNSNGTITASDGTTTITEGNYANIDSNKTITLTAEGDATHMFSSWSVTEDVSGDDVTVTNNTFTMPSCDVTVEATFVESWTFTYNINGNTVTEKYLRNDASITLPTTSEYCPEGYSIRGWTETESDLSSPITSANADQNRTFYAIFGKNVYGDFVKVTTGSTTDDWTGQYLIVYGTDSYAFDGSRETLDNTFNNIPVTISNNKIVRDNTTEASMFTIASNGENKYSIRSASGYYIGGSSSGSLSQTTDNTTYQHEISVSYSTAIIKCGSNYLRVNNASDQKRFRYYNTNSPTVQLYKSGITLSGSYTRIYTSNEVATEDITIVSPTIIESGTVLNMGTHTLTNNTADNLIIEDGGQLITTSTGVKATVKKTTTASTEAKDATNNWYAISSPVNEIAISSFAKGTHNVYSYDEPTHYWNEYRSEDVAYPSFLTLENGRGYLYRSTEANIEFAGDVNVYDATYTLTYTPAAGNLAGFHLIGNPYTHNIYKGANAAINSEYLTDGLYTLNVNGGWEAGTDNTTAIAPGCAVLVQAKEEAGAGQTLTITNTDHQGPEARYANDQIMFTVKNSEYSDNSYVLFKKGQGLNKIEHRNAEIPMLYVISEGENYAIADMPDNTDVINIGFEAKTMGQYTISLKAEGQYSYMHLVDKLTGNDIDMLVEDSYTFVGTPNDRNDRFVLRLNYNAAGIDTESDIFAYQSGNDIMVSGEGELQVFDITGRKVMTTDINGVETINGMNRGVYIFRLNEKTQKIVVR